MLILPAGIGAAVLVGSPLRNWLAAASVAAATLLIYSLIHLGRLSAGHKLGAPPSARATAAAEALSVAVPPYAGAGGEGGAADAADSEIGETAESGRSCAADRAPQSNGSGSRGNGDAWFGKLVASYRRVPDREQQAAAEMVPPTERTEVDESLTLTPSPQPNPRPNPNPTPGAGLRDDRD